jgi:hypothetical protein
MPNRSNAGGSGGFGGNAQAEHLIASDTNRQILLILLRLQQDTNSILTRLSYLEASFLSLQVCIFLISPSLGT